MYKRELIYLGPEGTFSEEACLEYVSAHQNLCVPGRYYPTIREVVTAAAVESSKLAIVPLENSYEGAVTVTLDLLAGDTGGLRICGETVLRVHHQLMAVSGTRLKDVSCVLSHPQALGQCQEYLAANLPGVRQTPTASTAEAARLAAAAESSSGGAWAAICTTQAGERCGLILLASEIQDSEENCTRFIILGHHSTIPTGSDKTSLVFTTADKPGALYQILGILAEQGINLTKIESRPTRKRLGEYLFYVDLEGHCADKAVATALKRMTEMTAWMRVLGSYPRAV